MILEALNYKKKKYGSILRIAFISLNPRIFRALERVRSDDISILITKYYYCNFSKKFQMIFEALTKNIWLNYPNSVHFSKSQDIWNFFMTVRKKNVQKQIFPVSLHARVLYCNDSPFVVCNNPVELQLPDKSKFNRSNSFFFSTTNGHVFFMKLTIKYFFDIQFS